MTQINKINDTTMRRLVATGGPAEFNEFFRVFNGLVDLCRVTEGSGVPTYFAPIHTWYFDTATSKYYRNSDGSNTWVALN